MPKGIQGFQKGHPNIYGFQKGCISSMKGKHHSEETKRKQSLSNILSHMGVKLSEEHRMSISLGMIGRQVTQITRGKISIANKGEKHGGWKGEDAVYSSKHCWIRRNYGNPPFCEDCGKIGQKVGRTWNIDWSNCDGKYRRTREDYNGRCRRCHIKYDKTVNGYL